MLKNLLQKWFGGRSKTTVTFALKLMKLDIGYSFSFGKVKEQRVIQTWPFDKTVLLAGNFAYEFDTHMERIPVSLLTEKNRVSSLHVEQLITFFDFLRKQCTDKVLYIEFELGEDIRKLVTTNAVPYIFEYCLKYFKGYTLLKHEPPGQWTPVKVLENITLEEIYRASRRTSSNDKKGV